MRQTKWENCQVLYFVVHPQTRAVTLLIIVLHGRKIQHILWNYAWENVLNSDWHFSFRPLALKAFMTISSRQLLHLGGNSSRPVSLSDSCENLTMQSKCVCIQHRRGIQYVFVFMCFRFMDRPSVALLVNINIQIFLVPIEEESVYHLQI